METKDFFDTLQKMRGYRGDTFPVFYVKTDAEDLTGCSMRLILEDIKIPGSIAFPKDCAVHTFEDGAHGFSVQLDSADTANLCGTYTMHFIMTGADGREYRKLVGTLVVLDAPKGGA